MARRIPLTDEILLKNGFCDHPDFYGDECICHHFYLGSEYYIEDEDLHIGRDEKSSSYSLRYGYSTIFGIKSVEELQWFFNFFHIGIEIKTSIVYGVLEPQEEEEEETE